MTAPWLVSMAWRDLLFAHWPAPAARLAPLVPAGLTLDTFDGQAWLGVVPFTMADVRPRGLPAVPGVSTFAELNLRTYVRSIAGERRGVWFFSLDAASPLAVRAGRLGFHLPYFDARMEAGRRGDTVAFASHRTHRAAPPGAFRGRYGPAGPASASQPGTLEHWLTERDCLYSADRRGRVFRGEVRHAPWPLRPAWAEIEANSLAEPLGLDLGGAPALLHFADAVDVVAWPLARVL